MHRLRTALFVAAFACSSPEAESNLELAKHEPLAKVVGDAVSFVQGVPCDYTIDSTEVRIPFVLRKVLVSEIPLTIGHRYTVHTPCTVSSIAPGAQLEVWLYTPQDMCERFELPDGEYCGVATVASEASPAVDQEDRSSGSPGVEVFLNRFSGLPDPSFEISSLADLRVLRELVQGIPEVELPERWPPFLGGFSLVADEQLTRFPADVLVVEGVIRVTTADGSDHTYQDAKGLEEFLRRKAIEAGWEEHL